MKNKSKKRYAWTAKQIRKSCARKRWWPHPPKDFRKPYWGTHRANEKYGIWQFLNGMEDYKFPYHHKHSATWDYA